MSKRTPDEKIASVERYIRGETSMCSEAHRLGVNESAVRDWVRIYQTFGVSGFFQKNNRSYTTELKIEAVSAYLNGEGSLSVICQKYEIRSTRQLRNWIKVYNGHRELRPSSGRGSDIYMTKGRKTTYEERIEIVSYCIEHGNDYTGTIEKYGISYQQIYSWVKKYAEKGADGLKDKRGKRKPESEMDEMEKLRAENRLLAARNKRLEMENEILKKLKEYERGWK